MKITKELIEKLTSPDILKKDYDHIIGLIDEKVDDIWRKLLQLSCRKLDWWCFDNDVEYDSGDGSSGGTFDPTRYSNWIYIIGKFSNVNNSYYKYNDGFPTRFLWMEDKDVETEILTNVGQSHAKLLSDKENDDKKQEEKKKKREEMAAIIRAKLTKEELEYIKFK